MGKTTAIVKIHHHLHYFKIKLILLISLKSKCSLSVLFSCSLNKLTLLTDKLPCLVTWCMSYYKNRALLWHNTLNSNHIPFIIIRWLQHNLNKLQQRKIIKPNFLTIFKRDINKNLLAGCWKTKQNMTKLYK